MKRHATAIWNGNAKEGKGELTTQSKALSKATYTFNARFEDSEGKSATNPEELIAASHAGCFAMALSVELSKAGYEPAELKATSNVTIGETDGGFAIQKSELDLDARVENISEDEFQKIAEGAKENCPVSKVLNCEITLNSNLS